MTQYYAKWRDGFEVVWRNLTWAEYNRFKDRFDSSAFAEPAELALEIYKLVRIDGPDPKFVPAGIPGYICKQQMIDNPFSGEYNPVANAVGLARQAVTGNFLLCAKALIASSLHYRLDEIDQWDPNTFFIRLAQAELVLGRPIEPVNPKAVKENGKGVDRRQLTNSQRKAIDRTKQREVETYSFSK